MSENRPLPNPLEDLLPQDIATTSARMIRMRWVLGAMVLVGTVVATRLLHLPLPEPALYLTGLGVLAYNALLLSLAGRLRTLAPEPLLRRVRGLIVLQVALDWVTAGVVLHLTGGVASPAIPFFIIHMLMVTLLLGDPRAYLLVSIGVVVELSLLAALEATGVLPHYRVLPILPAGIERDPIFILAQIGFFSAAAVATVALSASIMTRLRERERQVNALYLTAQAVSSSLSLQTVLEQLARSAAQALATNRASIRLLDSSGDRLDMVAAYGLSQEYKDKGPVELSRDPSAREALGGKPLLIRNTATDSRLQYPQQVMQEGIRSILVVPIIGREKPLGVLRVYGERPESFSEADAEFAAAVARQGALAIENAMSHEALQRAEAERALFVRQVTHELRAPVAASQSLLRVLAHDLADKVDRKQKEILERVENRLDALLALIQDLLALAATKTPGFQASVETLELNAILKETLKALEGQSIEKQVRVDAALPREPVLLKASREGLGQIFGNLVGNALKYTPVGGQVRLTAEVRGRSVTVTVADTGMGIPSDDLPHLWEEFFRGRNARQSGITGTGLGLSIVKRLVESYGGNISLKSVENSGTTFTVTLPTANSEPIG